MIEGVNTPSVGEYPDEETSMAHFDELAAQSGMFRHTMKEVPGYVLQPRLGTPSGKGVCIDRILWPSEKIMSMGWQHGPIGVEGKTSGYRIGPAILQAMDYHASVFEYKPGHHIKLEWIFLWPFDRVAGDIASVMVQNRIGVALSTKWSPLCFKNDSTHMLRFNGETIDVATSRAGNKRGSR